MPRHSSSTTPTVPHTSSLSLPGWGRMILPAIKRYTHAEMPLVVGQMRLHSCSRPTEISTNSLLNHRWWESSSFMQQEYKSPQCEPSKQNGITSVKASNKAQREHLLFSFSTRRHLHRINVSQIVSTTMPLGWKHSRFQALMPFDETTKAIHGNEKTARPFTAHKAAAIPIDSLDVVESLNTEEESDTMSKEMIWWGKLSTSHRAFFHDDESFAVFGGPVL